MEESDIYLTYICRDCWSRKSPVKIDETSGAFINFHQVLSAPVMSTDVGQVGVTLFPSF